MGTSVDHTYQHDHMIRVGRGEPLLLLHGLGLTKESWDPVLPGLGGRFDVAAIDLPGFGGAPMLDVDPSDEALADHCEQVMDALGWETAHLAGNSLGGLVSLRLASRGRARSVTALSPSGQIVGWEHRWTRTMLQTIHRLGPLVARVGPLSDWSIGRRIVMGTIYGQPHRMTPGYARQALEGLVAAEGFQATLDAAEWQVGDIKPIEAPVTIAWGTRDVLLWPWQGQRWAERIPGSRLVRLPGLGHTPMPDDPDMVIDVITRTARAAG